MRAKILYINWGIFLGIFCNCTTNNPKIDIDICNGIITLSSTVNKPLPMTIIGENIINLDTVLVQNMTFDINNRFRLSKDYSSRDSINTEFHIKDIIDTIVYVKIPRIEVQDGRIILKNIDGQSKNLLVEIGDIIKLKIPNIENNCVVDCLDSVRRNTINHYRIAYYATQNNGLPISASIPGIVSVKSKINLNRKVKNPKVKSSIISGLCNPLVAKELQYDDTEIRKYLFRNNIHFDDSLVNRVGENLALLQKSDYYEYQTRDSIVPIITDLSSAYYKVSSTMKADYYYLILNNIDFPFYGKECNIVSNLYLKKFIEQEVGNNFSNGVLSLDNPLKISEYSYGGSCLILVGINKDWTYQYSLLGFVILSSGKPFIMGDTSKEAYDARQPTLASLINGSINSSASTKSSTDKYLEKLERDRKFEEDKKKPRQILLSENNIMLYAHPKLDPNYEYFPGGTISFEVMDFTGNNPRINLSWSNNIKYVQFGNQPKIDLSEHRSPKVFTFSYYTNLGDNYVPITVTNSLGKTAESKVYFKMHPIKNNQTIIENTIINSPNSSITNIIGD